MLTVGGIPPPSADHQRQLGRWRVIGVGWAIYAGMYAGHAFTGGAGV